ncbi:MAG: ankyrin repeat domain-containing protein [Alphaproteobacteria bacterium]|nr:ankyrin repeat domain-containing protein [Alphaproteobacteria bacterium]
MARKPTFNGAALPQNNSAALPPDAAFFDRIRQGDVGAVKNVLATRKAAANWQQTSSGQRGLHLAAMTNQRKIAAELVKAGAEIEARDHLGRTPLLQAARSGQPNMIEFLLLNRADIKAQDKEGNTVLHLAAESISADTIVALIEAGADSSARNKNGGTAIDVALAHGNRAMAELIRSQAQKHPAAPAAALPPLHETVREIEPLKPLNPRKRTQDR